MTKQDFIRAWGGDHRENPLAQIRQALQNLQGYGELILEDITDDGFRPAAASDLDEIKLDCRRMLQSISNLLFVSHSLPQAVDNLHQGLLPNVESILKRVQKLVEMSRNESFAGDLAKMVVAGQAFRDLLDEMLRRGRLLSRSDRAD